MFELIELTEQASKAAGLDMKLALDRELVASVQAIAAARAALDAAEAHALVELDERKVPERDLGLTTGMWLAREARVSVPEGRCRVRTANKLAGRLTTVGEALCDGVISYAHAKVIAQVANRRIINEIAEIQEPLIELSKGMLFDAWVREVRGIAEQLDADGGYDPARDLDRNELSMSPTLDGMLNLAGRLTPDRAGTFTSAVEAKADELFRRYRDAHRLTPDVEVPSRRTLLALALGKLVTCGLAVDVRSSRPARASVSLILNAADPDTITGLDGTRFDRAQLDNLLCDA